MFTTLLTIEEEREIQGRGANAFAANGLNSRNPFIAAKINRLCRGRYKSLGS